MYPRPYMIRLDHTPRQAEFLYWELLALQSHYDSQGQVSPLSTDDALTLANTIARLGSELDKAQALADVQLQQLKRARLHSVVEED